MGEKILIVEDEFIVANDLRLILERAGYKVVGIAGSVAEALELIRHQKPQLVLLDIYLKGNLTGIDLARQLPDMNIAFVYLSANSNQRVLEEAKATQPYGFLVKPFREKDVLIMLDIARYRHENSLESKFRQEVKLQKLLVNISSEAGPWEQKLLNMAKALQSFIPFDYLTVALYDPKDHFLNGGSYLRIGFDQYQIIKAKELSVISGLPLSEIQRLPSQCAEKKAAWYNRSDFIYKCQEVPIKKLLAKTFQLASHLILPVQLTGGNLFCLTFYSKQNDTYHTGSLEFLNRFLPYLAVLGEFIPAAESVDGKMVSGKGQSPVADQQAQASNFENIIGNSHNLLHALDHVAQVAPLDTSVLILGESGTGKEKIAQAIHNLSQRKSGPLVKINCAALPSNLIESELFGHEKGAFTGAIDKRIGKFEQAAGGTVFLDEIGEMPIEMQVKLLRVLQEKEIERIGGKAPININVRIIAATNRNLEKEVAAGRFRLDLYYRLNVFPITLPPLRERMEDIQPLATYFAIRFSEKFNKPFSGISKQMTDSLEAYRWPGNIRELENVIEQAVILNQGHAELTLMRPLTNAIFIQHNAENNDHQQANVNTMADVRKIQVDTERDYIISVLKKTNGRIRGAGGAAELLKLKPTTLESRIARLGIKKDEIQ